MQNSKESNKTLYTNAKDLKCFGCNQLLSFLLPYDYRDTSGEFDFFKNGKIVDENTVDHISICDEEGIFYVCPKCDYYYMCCPNCSGEQSQKIQLCRFLGHYGFFNGETTKDIKKYRTTEKTFNKITKKSDGYSSPIGDNEIEEHKKNLEILNDESLTQFSEDIKIKYKINNKCYRIGNIPYYVGDKNLYFFDVSDVWATGPDGGYPHFWVCSRCNIGYKLSDK